MNISLVVFQNQTQAVLNTELEGREQSSYVLVNQFYDN